jgi:hypothetical protein
MTIQKRENSVTSPPSPASLPSLRPGLLKHRLEDEVLVYDTALANIHLLDGTTARVAELLDQGRDEVDIVTELEVKPGSGAGAPLLALALDELSKADLVEYPQPARPMSEVTRRQLLQKLAVIGAGLVIPMVLSVTPGRAGAQSAGCGQFCASKTTNCHPFAGCTCCVKPNTGFDDHTCQAIPYDTQFCHGDP